MWDSITSASDLFQRGSDGNHLPIALKYYPHCWTQIRQE